MFNTVLSSLHILVILATAICDNEIVYDCTTKLINGTCIKVIDCPYAIGLISNHDYNTLFNLKCGFKKLDPQVCCPQSSDPPISYMKEEAATNRPRPTTLKPIPSTTFRPKVQKNDTFDIFPNKTICGRIRDRGVSDRIVGGSVVEVDEHPWLARIQYQYGNETGYGCSAALITNLYLLTAAHCLQDSSRIPLSAQFGEWNIKTDIDCRNNICNENTVNIKINNTIIYPTNNIQNIADGDIALIRLTEPVNFTNFIQPICLPTSKYIAMQDYGIDSAYWVAGWGQTEYESESTVKRQVQLNAVPIQICRNIFSLKPETEQKIICAGGIKGKDTCSGDSGGPLVKIESENYEENWYVFGITSSGSKICGKEGVPGVYTRVSAYMNWIRENVRE